MSLQYVGKPCEECANGVCTMNCSGAVPATRFEWIAASMWAGVFPEKASAEQVRAWKASTASAPRPIAPPAVVTVPESTNAQHAAMFARIRANAEKLTIQSGDLTDLLATVALAERAVMGEGEHAGAGWLRSMFARNGVLLPLAVDKDGAVCDRLGSQVLVIDVNRERTDDKVAEIAALIVLAVNTCGGHAPRAEAA